MSQFDFKIGAKIHCKDGDCGELEKLVIDSYTKEITDLIVKDGRLFKKAHVIPAGMVDRAATEDIYLSINRSEFKQMPQYREYEYESVEGENAGGTPQPIQYMMRSEPYGVLTSRSSYPARIRQRVRENVSPDSEVVERSTPVSDKDGKRLGTLDHILLDRESCDVTFIIVDRGGFDPYKVIPFAMIDELSGDKITLKVKAEELADLPDYMPRGDPHILSEMQDCLQNDNAFEGVTARVHEGVMELTGYVKDALTKRRVESAASSIKGVMEVKNNLFTDAAIEADITAALLKDARTELAVIDISSEEGNVTLKGEVDEKQISQAAEEIAASRSGVVSVKNLIKLGNDEYSAYLKSRSSKTAKKLDEID
jgi:osmotically-inducible protein OsmY/uncharacterized protein YrrD